MNRHGPTPEAAAAGPWRIYAPLLMFCYLLANVAGCSPTSLPSAQRQAELQSLDSAASLPDNGLLADRIKQILVREREQRRLDTAVNAAWQIMHAVIPYGTELQIATPDHGLVGALEYAFSNGEIQGFEISTSGTSLPSTGRPGVMARLEPGSYVGQGHPDQWLAIFAMCELPPETPIQVGDSQLSVLDLARQAQFDVPNNLLNEFGWTLIGLTHYFPEEAEWQASGGVTVNWEMLVQEELRSELNLQACGGTHLLSGITRALLAKQRLGLADSPVWEQAQAVVDQHLSNARQNRSPNGALSSYYFVRPSQTVDLSAELASSGHIFEFVALALPTEQLAEPWVQLAASHVCDLLDMSQAIELDCGALYHALNGLKIYQRRLQNENHVPAAS